MREELTKRNGKGVWIREIEKGLKMFDASLQWLMERTELRDAEIDRIRHDDGIEENERSQVMRAKRAKSIADVLEEVEVLIDTHFFNEFWETVLTIPEEGHCPTQCSGDEHLREDL